MRSRYRIYACPADACPKVAFKPGQTCPTHSKVMEAIVVKREIPETPEQKKNRELLEKLERQRAERERRGLQTPSFESIVKDMFKF